APALFDDFTLQHLKQHVGATARAVLFLEGHHVAGTHRSSIVLTALAKTDAAERRPFDRPTIVGIGKTRMRLPRRIVGTEAKVFGREIGVDNFVGVESAIGIPNRLELAKRLDQLLAEHLWKQRTA